jgi:hypothetical protein
MITLPGCGWPERLASCAAMREIARLLHKMDPSLYTYHIQDLFTIVMHYWGISPKPGLSVHLVYSACSVYSVSLVSGKG